MLCMPRMLVCCCLLVCLSFAQPALEALDGVTTVEVAGGLNRPIMATAPEGDLTRLFIVEQRGLVKILNLLTLEVNDDPFLDIDSSVFGPIAGNDERGLLGLAFHPDYDENGYFFVHYSGVTGDTVVSRFSVDPDNDDLADEDSEVVLFEVSQPFANHNGGTIEFSPVDGYLYIGLGDGGSANDPGDRAQDGESYHGKMLRIDVDDFDSEEYAIPADNPFVDDDDFFDEIWAYGLRNPYRWCFDRETGDMYIGDVGQGAREEIDFQPGDSEGGENYGWSCEEGFIGTANCTGSLTGVTDPLDDYTRGGTPFRCSITGGRVYRGSAIADLDGVYFYADWCSNQIWTLAFDGTDITDDEDVTDDIEPATGSIATIAGFGEDGWGELYIVERGTSTTGQIFKIVPDDIEDFDCNGNFIHDDVELENGLAKDCNSNDLLDGCEGFEALAVDDAADNDIRGQSVAIDGEWAITSAPQDDDNGSNSGSAYFFRWEEPTVQHQKVTASDGSVGDDFGRSVALEGTTAFVGARRKDLDDDTDNTGAVYVFEYDEADDLWEESQILEASDQADGDEFGFSVAVSGTTLVVGAQRVDGAESNSGAAYVFEYDGIEWVEVQKLTASDAAGFDEFGNAVAVDGDWIVVASHRDDDTAANSGSVYVFTYDVGEAEWVEDQKLVASSPGGSDDFGTSVAVQGDLVAVGASMDDDGGSAAGTVFVFRHDGTTWSEEQILTASDASAGDHLGESVAINGSLIASGANDDDDSSGALYLFVYDSVEWTETDRIVAPVREPDDEFGTSVAVNSGIVLVGAPGTEDAEGVAYLVQTPDCNSNGVHDGCDIADGAEEDCNESGVPDSCELQFARHPGSKEVASGDSVTFAFELTRQAPDGTAYQWRKDGVEIDGATEPSYTLDSVGSDDSGDYDVVLSDVCLESTSEAATLTVSGGDLFKRGDFDGNGTTFGLVDALFLLEYAFLDGPTPPCMDGADADDNGTVFPLLDASYLLNYQFNGTAAPPAPGPDVCGPDATDDDELGCDTIADECS